MTDHVHAKDKNGITFLAISRSGSVVIQLDNFDRATKHDLPGSLLHIDIDPETAEQIGAKLIQLAYDARKGEVGF